MRHIECRSRPIFQGGVDIELEGPLVFQGLLATRRHANSQKCPTSESYGDLPSFEMSRNGRHRLSVLNITPHVSPWTRECC